jgi:hypothetical protein
MVGDWFRPATMQPAWRAEEESDNRFESATMQPAWRPDHHDKTAGDRNRSGVKPADDVQVSAPDEPT